MTTPDFKAIAAQLRQPSGNDGVITAERMSDNNGNMIRRCIDHMNLQNEDQVLEMGPGGGAHLPYVLAKANNIRYTGVDISDTMVALAITQHKDAIEKGTASFMEVKPEDGYVSIPAEDNTFDRIFTVNTLYFWDNAAAQAKEIYRVMQSGGQFALCFATETFMKTLPFTAYGFNLYTVDKASALLQEAGFHISNTICEKEQVVSNSGESLEREFVVLLAGKS
jgi:ubiquinone/menaquinone biosynthesis C-methylase UbiE